MRTAIETQVRNPDLSDPREHVIGRIGEFYSLIYKKEKDDSPDESRTSIIQRLDAFIGAQRENPLVLDLGAGRQSLEYEYQKKHGEAIVKIVTVDIANMTGEQLLAPGVEHVIASGTHLPFMPETFSAAISNMALDFMPKSAVDELHRILKPDAKVFLNLHHPSLIPPDLSLRMRKFYRKMQFKKGSKKPVKETDLTKKAILDHMKFLQDEKILFENEVQIIEAFDSLGFIIDRVATARDSTNIWWEVDLTKIKA